MKSDSYDFHGIAIQVSGPLPFLACLRSRLGHFRSSHQATPVLRFRYRQIASPSEHPAVPSGQARVIYEPTSGQVRYFPERDLLYLTYGEDVVGLCSPSTGETLITCLGSAPRDLWYATHPFFTLSFLECAKRLGFYSIHASAIALNGRSILFCGASGAGKSTLALALAVRGFELCGDDMQFLRVRSNLLEVNSFPEDLDLDSGTAELLQDEFDFRSLERLENWPKSRFPVSKLECTGIALITTPVALVFPRVAHIQRSVITSTPPYESFLAIAPNVLLTSEIASRDHLAALSNLAESLPGYSLETGTDFDAIAAFARGLLEFS